MARIAGIDLPKHKRGVIGLTYIFGIGRSRAKEILKTAQVDEDIKVNEWNDEQITRIREAVSSYKIEGELRSEVQLNIKRLMDIGCYRGIRHRQGCLCVVKKRRITLVQEKENEKLLLTRRKQLNNK